MKKAMLLLLILMSAGCVRATYTHLQIDKTVTAHIDSGIRCGSFPENTCAIGSEFHELADRAFRGSAADDPQHFVSLLDIGQDALLARIHLIRAAKKSIDLQTFVWADDESGNLIFVELLKAARRGVKVRLLIDQFSIQAPPELIARLAAAHTNLEIRFYNPTLNQGRDTPLTFTRGMLFSFNKLNQRMHNKLVVIDGRIGIVGGRNIQNKYYDYDTEFNFKDRDVIIAGPAVKEMRDSFQQYWDSDIVVKAAYLDDVGDEIVRLTNNNDLKLTEALDLSIFADIIKSADEYSICSEGQPCRPFLAGRVQYLADIPGKPSETSQESRFDPLKDVLNNAKRSITIQTPYLVLSKPAYKRIKDIKKDNPDIQLNVSTNSLASTDAYMVYAMSYKYKKRYIKKLKFNLYEFKPRPGDARRYIPRYEMLVNEGSDEAPNIGMHAKTMVVDGEIAIVGSHNFDSRSAIMNTENIVIIWDRDVAAAVEQNIMKDTEPQNSWVIAKRQAVPVISHFSGFIGEVSRVIPFFDVWPFRYTSSYQLKDGMEALPADHPDFYEHYSDVGQFPEAGLSSKAIRTRLMKAFGGSLEPLM
jgi:putative cardiolipin synthase